MDEEKDVGQAGRGADAIEGDNVDKLDGKIRDDPAGAVNVFTNKGTTMGLPVLGVLYCHKRTRDRQRQIGRIRKRSQ